MNQRIKKLALTTALSLLITVPAYAQTPAVSVDFGATMPAGVQSVLAKSSGWQTIAMQDTAQDYWLLLEDGAKDAQQMDAGTRNYELLQISKTDRTQCRVQSWSFNNGALQGDVVPAMQCSEQGVWVLFQTANEAKAFLVDADHTLHSYSLKTAQVQRGELTVPYHMAALGQDGVAGYDAEKNAFIIWNGKSVTPMVVNTPVSRVRKVTCRENVLYYLDDAGNFYKASEGAETWISNLQDMYENIQYKHTGPEDSYKLDYIESLNLCCCNGLLWLSGADLNLPGGSALLQYDGNKFVQYDIEAGHILHITPGRNGSTTLATSAYSPTVPGLLNMKNKQIVHVTTVKNGSVLADEAFETANINDFFYTGVQVPYTALDGEEWLYGGPDALLQQMKPDGTTYGYALQPAKPDIHIVLDGTEYYFDRQPVIRNSRTMVPLRGIASLLDMQVNWKDNTVTLLSDDTSISLTPGKKSAMVNDTEVALDSPAINLDGRILVPLRFVAENFNAKVDWLDATRTVTIGSDAVRDLCEGVPVVEETPAVNEKEHEVNPEEDFDVD